MNDREARARKLIKDAHAILPPAPGGLDIYKIADPDGNFRIGINICHGSIPLAHMELTRAEAVGLVSSLQASIQEIWG